MKLSSDHFLAQMFFIRAELKERFSFVRLIVIAMLLIAFASLHREQKCVVKNRMFMLCVYIIELADNVR